MNFLATSCTRGRPREFCVDEALAAALRVFWSKGYEGASLSDLTEAMGIAKPSLYAAFGNKEALFRQALDLYEREKLAYMQEALATSSSRAVVDRLLRGAIANQTGHAQPKGCLGVITSAACGSEAESIRAEVIARSQGAQRALIERLERARDDGDLPATADVEALTRMIFALLQGMALQAGAGATREDLDRVADAVLASWPGR